MKRLYLFTASLLIVHEIDSASWREWDLFGLPGGIDLFLAVHVPLALLVLWGYGEVIAGSRGGLRMSFAVSAAAIAAGGIHAVLLARGGSEFRSVASISLLAATVLSGLALLGSASGALRAPGAGQR